MKHRILLVIGCMSLSPPWSVVWAQTLSGEYDNYLKANCANMNFQRDENHKLLPGQAGPHLFSYCSGGYVQGSTGGYVDGSTRNYVDASGGSSLADVSLGASGPESNSGADEDAVSRRRGERARNAAKPEADEDFNLLESGGTSLFLSIEDLRQDQKQTDYQSGRRASNYTVSLGVDTRLGTTGLIGATTRYTTQSGDIDAGGNFLSHAAGGTVYGSWFPMANMFVDVSAGLDSWHATTQRLVARQETSVTQGYSYSIINSTGQVTVVTPPVVSVYYVIPPELATGEAHSSEASANLLMGYDVALGRFSIGPRAGLRLKDSSTDAVVETGDTPMALVFDPQTQTSLRSTLGAQAGMSLNMPFGVIVTQANADWIHEYRDDQTLLSARFAEDYRPDPTRLHFLTQAPDRDFLEARLSAVMVLPHSVSIFVSINSSIGNALLDQYGATLGARFESL